MSSFRLPISFLPLVVGLALLTGACGAPLAITAGSYAADGGLMVASDKSSTDHLASMVSKKDCALWRVFRGREVCKEREEGAKDPYAVDYNEPQRSVSEDGTTYGPPLRPAPDAPAASWDAAAYKSSPTPSPAPAEPVTAVADATPAQPVAAAPAAPKARKAKVARSAKKPSRGRAAPAP
ncbi:MAG: hypothetical protein EPO55_00150 [Reyranella sp.]|uniref:hypothetical protein n=1 Tax=Reyranella sp. TaxID=1929291 RepID=UPI00121B4208|nr:hypothetical protein [Reyranella sp.]TAJ43004.1 MAG: hypothetical protein EPO55_00150 [Reyranella sp.]